MPPANHRRHSPGFRFSASDGIVLLAGAAATIALWFFIGGFAIIVPLALAHFFLFCNVFRIRRKYELIWAAIFIVNVWTFVQIAQLNWWLVLAAQTPITAALICMEIASEQYHGVGSSLKRNKQSCGI